MEFNGSDLIGIDNYDSHTNPIIPFSFKSYRILPVFIDTYIEIEVVSFFLIKEKTIQFFHSLYICVVNRTDVEERKLEFFL